MFSYCWRTRAGSATYVQKLEGPRCLSRPPLPGAGATKLTIDMLASI